MTDEPGFTFVRCEVCEFSAVMAGEGEDYACPLCFLDNGQVRVMSGRICREADRPEGFDARKLAQTPGAPVPFFRGMP